MSDAPSRDPELRAWLESAPREDVLEPDLEIVDAHHHLWDNVRLGNSFPYREKRYRMDGLLEDIISGGHNVIATVYVQAGSYYRRDGPAHMRSVGEVEYVQGVAAAADSGIYKNALGRVPRLGLGIQGSVDLKDSQCEEALNAMRRFRNFRGVRAGGPFNDAFRRGMALLQAHGLVFDRWHHPRDAESWIAEISNLAALAREFPKVTIVMDHLGGAVGPKMSEEGIARWKEAISDIATCENVYCKCGGIQMKVNGFGLEAREIPIGSEELCELVFPWYEHAIRSFTPERCMFESNFPVDKDCVSYRTLWNTLKRVAARLGLSAEEKRAIFKGTAMKVYRLREEGDYSAL